MKTYTEAEIKAMATPEIIKKMVELAEGFAILHNDRIKFQAPTYSTQLSYSILINDSLLLPLLIHRAIEGFNNKVNCLELIVIYVMASIVQVCNRDGICTVYVFSKYQPESLTACELACLHCLIEILKEAGK